MMSLLDGLSGYNQIKLKRTDRYKTTFTTHWGHFLMSACLLVCLMKVPPFKRYANSFDDLSGKIIQVYLYDLIVYSKNRLDPFGHLRKVLMCFAENLAFL
jgi:hypothetical protein